MIANWTYKARGMVKTQMSKNGVTRYSIMDHKAGKAVPLTYSNLPVQAQDVRRIIEAILHAWNDPWMRERGMSWYAEWCDVGRSLAAHFGVGEEMAIAVLCVTSPGSSPKVNIGYAMAVLAGGGKVGAGQYDAAQEQSKLIMKGADWKVVMGGKKVRAFTWDTLARGITDNDVTVDRWCWRTMTGDFSPDNDIVPDPWYRYSERAVRLAVRFVSWWLGVYITAAQGQALAWVADKDRHGEPDDVDVWAELASYGVARVA